MENKILKYILLISLSFTLKADAFKITLMGAYQNQSVYKGATTWAGPTMMVGPGFIFYEKFYLFGPSLKYVPFSRESSHELSMGLRYYDDNKPLIRLDDTQETYRNSRKNAVFADAFYRYKFGYRNKFYVGLELQRELVRFDGNYMELRFGTPFLPFTSLHFALSLADERTNEYLYGSEATSGDGYFSGSFNLFIPFVPWTGRIISNLKYTAITQGKARHADLVRGDYKNWSFVTRFIWDVY